MRRPLLFLCLCLVAFMALLYHVGEPPGGEISQTETVTVTGRIYQKDEASFYLNVQSIAAVSRQENPTRYQKKNYRLVCQYDEAESLPLGSTVVLRGMFQRFSSATNPGEFDYAGYYRSLGFAGRLEKTEIAGQSAGYSRVLEALWQLRGFWRRRLYFVFPEKEASVMTAILLGDKSGLDSGIKKLYQNNGIIHILSISGLHITLIGLGLYRVLRRLGMPVWTAALCGSVVLTLYGLLTGLSVSACRAIGMYLLRMLALLCRRTYDMLTAMGILAVLLVWRNPGYVEHMGFLLSFGSILGVGVLCPVLTPTEEERGIRAKRYAEGRRGQRMRKLWERLRKSAEQGFLAGLSITLTTLPVQLWFSYEIPVYSTLLNVLILPFMSVVVAAGAAAMLAPGLGFAGTLDVLVLTGYEQMCILFDRLPFHTWNPGRPGVWQIILYYILWLAVVWGTEWHRQNRKKEALRKRPGGPETAKYTVIIAMGKAAALLAAVLVLGMRIPGEDKITFLDVGQGDCVCAQLSSGEVYLFDCGSSSRGRIGERVLIPFLKYHGIGYVDGVFLSHPDADHKNGLMELFALGRQEHITVGQVILPAIAPEKREEAFGEFLKAAENASQREEIIVSYIQAGDRVWNGAVERFLCLHPSEKFSAEDSNAYSECFYIEFTGGYSVLLTGDVENAGEAALVEELRRRGIRGVTALKTAHHGSRNSTSRELLAQVTPEAAVISCGKNNRYGHPHEETLARLETVGAQVLRTDRQGAVTMCLKKNRMAVETFCR